MTAALRVVGENTAERFDDIVDIGEVPLHIAIVEDLDRPPRQHGIGE